jgi:dipeptidyl aminopeptidase/acylaminoacyl peptidase
MNDMKLRVMFFILVASALPVTGQVTIDNLLGVPFPSSLITSRDGKQIAWVFSDKGARNIWAAEAPEFIPKKITAYKNDDGQEITSLIFGPANEDIYFVKGGAPNSQNELPNPLALQEGIDRAIWRVSLKGELKKLAAGYYPKISPDGKTLAYLSGGQVYTVPTSGEKDGEKLFTSRGNQHSIRWSPDGSRIAFISGRNDHSFLGLYELDSKRLFFPDASVDHDDDPVWSPDGKQLAYVRTPNVKDRLPFSPEREGSPWSIRIFDVAGGTAKEIWRALPGKGSILHDGVPAIDNKIFWAADRIIFPWERDGWIHYYSKPVEGGEPILLTPGEGEVEQAALSADKRSLIYSANIGDLDRRHIYSTSLNAANQKLLTQGAGIEWSAVETSSGLVCLRSDAVTPAWVWNISDKGHQRMLAADLFPASFPKTKLIIPEPVSIQTRDGMKIPAQLFLPANHKQGEKYPAVIFFHGGSRRQMLLGFNYGQYYHHAYALNQFLAAQGYVVMSVNFRSGIGYGLDFREAIDYGAAGASEFNDVLAAGEHLKQRADVDGARIGLWGGSYGGYLTALGLTRAPELFSCGVDIHGVHDWNIVIKNFVPSYDAEKQQAFARKAFESSPIHFIKSWKAPVLLIHGDDDRNVPFGETVSLVEKLRAQNVYFEQLVFPDEVHSFLLHENWLRAYKATAEFFKKQFSDKKQPLSER